MLEGEDVRGVRGVSVYNERVCEKALEVDESGLVGV